MSSMNFINGENIEAYLTGKMSGTEKAIFEEGMSKDPLLKNEVDFQQDIIETLRTQRKAQLKSRLNNLEVGTTGGVSTGVKVAASFLAAGIISAGIYYFTKDNSEKNNTLSPEVTVSQPVADQLNNSGTVTGKSDKVIAENNSTITKTDVTSVQPKENRNNANSQILTSTSNDSHNAVNSSRIEVKVPGGDMNAENEFNVGDGEAPEATIEGATVGKQAGVDFELRTSKDLSYMFENNKLYLWGDFSKPYKIVEFAGKQQQIFLSYDGKYYEIKRNQTKKTRMKEVKDASVLDSLEKQETK